jgi:hypothetical protein
MPSTSSKSLDSGSGILGLGRDFLIGTTVYCLEIFWTGLCLFSCLMGFTFNDGDNGFVAVLNGFNGDLKKKLEAQWVSLCRSPFILL